MKVQQLGSSKRNTFKTLPPTFTTKSSFRLQKNKIAPLQSDALGIEQNNVCSPLKQDGIPHASFHHSTVIISSQDSFSIYIKAITPLPNRREKRLAALEIVTPKREGLLLGKLCFFIYQVFHTRFMSEGNTSKMVFSKRHPAAVRSMAQKRARQDGRKAG